MEIPVALVDRAVSALGELMDELAAALDDGTVREIVNAEAVQKELMTARRRSPEIIQKELVAAVTERAERTDYALVKRLVLSTDNGDEALARIASEHGPIPEDLAEIIRTADDAPDAIAKIDARSAEAI